MTAREYTVQRAIELFSVFKFNRFTIRTMQEEMPSFTKENIKHIKMFNLLDVNDGGNTRSYAFNKDPKTVIK